MVGDCRCGAWRHRLLLADPLSTAKNASQVHEGADALSAVRIASPRCSAAEFSRPATCKAGNLHLTQRQYICTLSSVRRKPDTLIPLEAAICEAAIELQRRGISEFHGYLLAKFIKDIDEARRFAGQGTLYRALDRLHRRGYVASSWEPPEAANAESRPARRLYSLTPAGRAACIAHRRELDVRPALRPLWRAL